MSEELIKPSYEVGWGKPPKLTRFKKGQSGNPQGRPKAVRNLKTDLASELTARIRIKEGKREISVSKQEAFIKSLVACALKGDARASSLLVSMIAKLPEFASAPPSAEVDPDEQAIIDAYYRRRFADLSQKSTAEPVTHPSILASLTTASPESNGGSSSDGQES